MKKKFSITVIIEADDHKLLPHILIREARARRDKGLEGKKMRFLRVRAFPGGGNEGDITERTHK